MSWFMWGGCDCKGCFFVNEEQAVYAMVRYANLAYYMVSRNGGQSYGPDIFPLDGSFSIPKIAYLGYTVHEEFYPADGSPSITVETENIVRDRFGNPTSSSGPGISTSGFTLASGPFYAWEFDITGQMIKHVATMNFVEGQLKIVAELNSPYTLAQAVANAVGLLDNVDLLNPYATYDVMYPYDFTTPDHIEAMHLAYPSEISANGWTNHQADQYFFVCNKPDGSTMIFVDRPTFIASIGVPAGAPMLPGRVANGTAIKGGYATTGEINDSLDGNIWAAKRAVRTSTGFTYRYDYFWADSPVSGYPVATINQGTIQNALVSTTPSQKVALNPVMPPGEYIFDPGDVPDFGSSLFNLPSIIIRTRSAGDTGTGAGATDDGGAL